MSNNYFRVDDRLIHGQIVAKWSGYLNIQNIIAIDEKTAKNPMLKSIMTMAVPRNYKSFICTLEEGKEIIKKLQKNNENNLIIMRFPHLLTALCSEEIQMGQVNIGNVSRKEGESLEVTKNVFLTPEDCEALEELHRRGVGISFKVCTG